MLLMASRVPHSCQLGNPATDGLTSRQAAHQAQKRVFLHFSSTNKLGGTFGGAFFFLLSFSDVIPIL